MTLFPTLPYLCLCLSLNADEKPQPPQDIERGEHHREQPVSPFIKVDALMHKARDSYSNRNFAQSCKLYQQALDLLLRVYDKTTIVERRDFLKASLLQATQVQVKILKRGEKHTEIPKFLISALPYLPKNDHINTAILVEMAKLPQKESKTLLKQVLIKKIQGLQTYEDYKEAMDLSTYARVEFPECDDFKHLELQSKLMLEAQIELEKHMKSK